MRRGGSGSGVAGAGAESGGGLASSRAAGLAVAIDPVRVGAASSTNAGTGAETGAGLTGAGASGWAVAIDPVRVGAASSKDGLVLAVVDKDARRKRREERYGHDERRFHGHGQTVSSVLPKES